MPGISVVHIVHIVRIVHIRVMSLVIFRVVYVYAFRRRPLKQAALLPLVHRQRGERDECLCAARAVDVSAETRRGGCRGRRTHLAHQRREFDAERVVLGREIALLDDRARVFEVLDG